MTQLDKQNIIKSMNKIVYKLVAKSKKTEVDESY